jgi:putative ABC transport system permease protein
MQNLLGDLRQSLRSLARSPVLTATIVLTVGLGIGATTAIFGVVDAVLLQPLPYADPGRLVRIYTDSPPNRWGFSVADYLALEEQQSSFQQVGAYANATMTFNRGAVAERLRGKLVSWNYFSLLGVPPLQGRTFDKSDGRPGSERKVVLSYGFWKRYLGGDSGAIGQTIQLDRNAYTVVGVLQPKVGPFEQSREFFAAAQWETPPRRGPFNLIALGRLRSDSRPSAAAAELRAINKRIFPIWQAGYQDQRATWGLMDLKDNVVGDVGATLLIVLGAVGFLLLIACTNAANLLLARATQRHRELAVRSALGASRRRLLLHLLVENALLLTGAALAGLWLAMSAMRLLATAGADFIPRIQEMSLSGPVLWFFAAVTVLSGLLFGLIPSLHGLGARLDLALRSSSRSATHSVGTRRLRRALVVAQFAVGTPLLIAAGLLISSLAKLQRVDPGFDSRNLLTAALSLPAERYAQPSDVLNFWTEAEARLKALPGVRVVGFSDGRPPNDVGNINNFDLEDHPTPAGQSPPTTPWVATSPEYFEALGLSLVRGRLFDQRDQAPNAPPVAVVDQAWAKRFFPGADAVGKRIHECDACDWITVVGVVSDVKYSGLDSPDQGTVYWPESQRATDHPMERLTTRFRFVIVRTAIDPMAVLPSIRQVVSDLDPSLPLSEVATIDELLADSLQAPRYLSLLVGAFAAVALVLAAVGIYGVMSYFVQQHKRDIGIRLALGGGPAKVLRLIVGQGMRLVAAGVILGIGAALALTRFMASLLFEVAATDLSTFAGASALMLSVALLACLVPARRATTIDPATILRED